MNMNKLKDFAKKYGFYLAVGVISLGAITAVFFTSNESLDNTDDFEVYAEGQELVEDQENQELEDTVVPEDAEVSTPEDSLDAEPEVTESEDAVDEVSDTTDVAEEPAEGTHTTQEVIETEEDEIVSETFNSTTVEEVDTPFFAEGDTMSWPVNGEIIVPYTDDTTRHWLSTALNQTMRTYGICIAAEEGTEVKAPASATVVDIIEDATTLDWYKRVGNVGQVIILDHGNGYETQIGVQGGQVDKSLLGQTIEAGTTIATVGQATGPFVDLESNVYMQVRHEDQIIDPAGILDYQASVADSVDMGHSEE